MEIHKLTSSSISFRMIKGLQLVFWNASASFSSSSRAVLRIHKFLFECGLSFIFESDFYINPLSVVYSDVRTKNRTVSHAKKSRTLMDHCIQLVLAAWKSLFIISSFWRNSVSLTAYMQFDNISCTFKKFWELKDGLIPPVDAHTLPAPGGNLTGAAVFCTYAFHNTPNWEDTLPYVTYWLPICLHYLILNWNLICMFMMNYERRWSVALTQVCPAFFTSLLMCLGPTKPLLRNINVIALDRNKIIVNCPAAALGLFALVSQESERRIWENHSWRTRGGEHHR